MTYAIKPRAATTTMTKNITLILARKSDYLIPLLLTLDGTYYARFLIFRPLIYFLLSRPFKDEGT
jgi:hypothetical protein